jgi:hypothetical protein
MWCYVIFIRSADYARVMTSINTHPSSAWNKFSFIDNQQHYYLYIQHQQWKSSLLFVSSSSMLIVHLCFMINLATNGVYSNVLMENNSIQLKKKMLGMSWNILLYYLKIISFYFIYSRNIWEANLAKIRQHNLQADMGMHTYTLGMNQFGDLVSFFLHHHT